jgi:HD domain-containing protein
MTSVERPRTRSRPPQEWDGTLARDAGRCDAQLAKGTHPLDEIVSHDRFLYVNGGNTGQSHAHWDGSGYPDQLAGNDIPVGARIILACDAYEAMNSDRPYRARSPRMCLRCNPCCKQAKPRQVPMAA